jgi:RHS repeat-associated protein
MNSQLRRVTIVLSLLFPVAAHAGDLKFHAASGPEPVIGRYLVTLEASIPADQASASAEALARAYNGQREPFASSEIRQFAIAMLPGRARTLSADPRVREVVEIAQSDGAPSPPPANSSATLTGHLTPIARDVSSSGTYLYDGSGNIKFIGSDSFVYDVDGRLMQATVQASQQSYTYDAFGNRLSATRAAGAAGCVGGCEAVVTVNHQTNHLAEQTYDEAGNVTSGFGAAYTYDGTGMVRRATVGSDDRIFVYTADDERLAVRNGVSWTWTVRGQGNKVLREVTSLETSTSPLVLSNHTWSKDHVWRDGLLLASVFQSSSGPTTYHYHLDHLGTPRMITASGGLLVAKHTYYPFGAEMDIAPHESAVEAMKFTGHERDLVAGDNHSVDYMHARFYNTNVGKFLAMDRHPGETERPQSWNRYSYASNNPIARFDPNGLRDIYVAIWNAKAPYFFGRGSVGHVGAFEMNGKLILSQFPNPHGSSGKTVPLGYADTVATEKRMPDAMFKVFVPDDKAFDASVAAYKARTTWYAFPTANSDTNCVQSVACTLRAGGVETDKASRYVDPSLPGKLGENLTAMTQMADQRWSVQSVPVDVLGTPAFERAPTLMQILELVLPIF